MIKPVSPKENSHLKIIELNANNYKEWDDFVNFHPRGNIFQSHFYYLIHVNMQNLRPFSYGVFKDDILIALTVGVIYSNYVFPIKYFTRRAIIIGGPLVHDDDDNVLDFFLRKLSGELKKKSIYIQFRNLWDIKNKQSIYYKNNYIYEEHLDIIHNLTLSKDEILRKISKNKRGNINKSANKGTQFKEITKIDEFRIATDLIKRTYKKVKLPCPNSEYFVSAFLLLHSAGLLRPFAAIFNNKIIGVRIELCYKDLVYDWYAGADEFSKDKYPNDFLPFNILLWAKENGFKKYDFGGAGKPGIPYGVRDHKLKFGGELVEYGRFNRYNMPYLFKFGSICFKIMRRLRTKI